jgi:hypothetical protein
LPVNQIALSGLLYRDSFSCEGILLVNQLPPLTEHTAASTTHLLPPPPEVRLENFTVRRPPLVIVTAINMLLVAAGIIVMLIAMLFDSSSGGEIPDALGWCAVGWLLFEILASVLKIVMAILMLCKPSQFARRYAILTALAEVLLTMFLIIIMTVTQVETSSDAILIIIVLSAIAIVIFSPPALLLNHRSVAEAFTSRSSRWNKFSQPIS